MPAKEAVAWYDDNADHYADEMSEYPIIAWVAWPGLCSLLPDLTGRRALDAGCGDGTYTRRLAEMGADVVGVDASDELLRIAKERHGEAVEFRRTDLREPLDFLDDGSIGVVVSQLALDHLEDWSSPFEEFARVLQPGGSVVCSVSHPPTIYAKLARDDDGEFGLDDPSYFETQRWSEPWGDDDGVTKYRRPLKDQVGAAFAAGLVLDGLHEPTPTEEFEREQPETAKRWKQRPSTFICYRFRKPPIEEMDHAH